MKNIFILILSMLFFPLNASAHPPSTIEIDYNQSEGRLYVYMDHLSRDHRKHYIRKTSILINGEEVKAVSNRQQIDPNEYAFSVDLAARENDEIIVKAYSSEGGTASARLVVPMKGDAEKPEEDEASDVKAKVNAYNNKDRSSEVYGSQEGVYDEKTEAVEKPATSD